MELWLRITRLPNIRGDAYSRLATREDSLPNIQGFAGGNSPGLILTMIGFAEVLDVEAGDGWKWNSGRLTNQRDRSQGLEPSNSIAPSTSQSTPVQIPFEPSFLSYNLSSSLAINTYQHGRHEAADLAGQWHGQAQAG
ncbi:hypothetical protein D0867_06664 [Hortaea werneckii]|uniref:Uncharacterized protein n=1 Tax=Hortaea werneckii TaxID=91943 RepID=A0A3M6ZL53_HORWE|nr:hypothetical protein D0867_06664 [Hortaea werneckii]